MFWRLGKMSHQVNKIFSQTTFEKEFKEIIEKVRFILTNNENARNNDHTLYLIYWMKFDGLDRRKFEDVISVYEKASDLLVLDKKFLTPAESITRARRKIQNDENKLQADIVTIAARQEKREAHVEMARGDKQ